MKQKEASVVEAAYARVSSDMATRQNYAMMTFTVVTVLLYVSRPKDFFRGLMWCRLTVKQLPLSFFTSLFGMNVREWSKSEHQESIKILWHWQPPVVRVAGLLQSPIVP
jgi:hypothetical protein